MSFPWLDRTPPATNGAEQRAKVAAAELADRAGLLFRLGFSQARRRPQRLIARIAWEFDPPSKTATTSRPAGCPTRRSPRSSPIPTRAVPAELVTRALAPGIAASVLALVAALPAAGARAAPRALPRSRSSTRSLDLVGGWRWLLRTERGRHDARRGRAWRFRARSAAADAARRPLRPHRRGPLRRSRAVPVQPAAVVPPARGFDVTVDVDADGGFAIHETEYRTEPSPCDHGFRHVGAYTAQLDGERLTLRWDDGTQTLWQTDDASAPLPEPTVAASRRRRTAVALGRDVATTTTATSATRPSGGRSRAAPTRALDAHVSPPRHRPQSPDGKPIACAERADWTFDDAYVLDGQREEEHWHFYELAAEPGDHPCLRATPQRTLDEATAEQIGDYLMLEWRGKRRQVLYRTLSEACRRWST